jgi:methionyl-tRNA formyltransferase
MKEIEKSRVAFLGGKPLGYDVLSYLVERENVVCVVTNEEDLNPVWYTSVKDIAQQHSIPYITTNINVVAQQIEDFKPDYMVCHGYDVILKDRVLSIPKYGAINLHTGLSEQYRGRYPTVFPILDGRKEAGVTIHEMTNNVDGGDIYAQALVAVDPTDTAESLYYKCAGAGASVFKHVWPSIKDGTVQKRPQITTEELKTVTKKDFPSLEIFLSWDAQTIDRHIRALTFRPFPKPYFVIDGKKFEIEYNKRK